MSTPVGSAPDERDHYVRAAGAGRSQVILESRPEAQAPAGVAAAWQLDQSRVVKLPGSLSPEVFECRSEVDRVEPCEAGMPPPSSPVGLSTYVGTYPPALYVVPGVAMRLADDPVAAARLGRLAGALLSILFIGLAALVLWNPATGWRSLLGLVAVATPMVVYTASTLSPSGPEAASALCFFACILRIARTRAAGTTVWVALGLSGLTLVLARDLGPVWMALGAVFLLVLAGLRGTAGRVKAGGRAAAAALVLALCGLAAALIWQATQQVRPDAGAGEVAAGLVPSPGMLQAVYFQTIGNFGVLDTPMNLAAYLGWTLLLGGLAVLGLVRGSRKQRLLLLGTGAATLVVVAVLDAIQRTVGFGAQGRHVLPMVAAFGLLAGEMAFGGDAAKRGWERNAGLAFAGIAAAIHGFAWFTAARRYAVGLDGPALFLQAPVWSPPGGWVVWALVAAVAAGLLVVAFAAGRFGEDGSGATPAR
ncbi:MAG TPA: DUF2142 domain-containing protein [Actinomycetota bacterium]|nr:DUF2142 domain-containing protein [Actinomycetota bacterium]